MAFMSRPVYFVAQIGGSRTMARHYTAAAKILGRKWKILSVEKLTEVKNSDLIFMKICPHEQAEIVKKGNNRIFYELHDAMKLPRIYNQCNPSLIDGVAGQSTAALRAFQNVFPNYKGPLKRILHCGDPSFQRCSPDLSLTFGYFGCNLYFTHCKNVVEKFIMNKRIPFICSYSYVFGSKEHTANCHLAIRPPQYRDFCVMPPTKIATAARVDAVVVATPDEGALDVLPVCYPYVLGGFKVEDILEGLTKVIETYEGYEWNLAREIIRELYRVEFDFKFYIERWEELLKQ